MKDKSLDKNNGEIALDEIYGNVQNLTRIFYFFLILLLVGIVTGIIVLQTTRSTTASILLASGLIPALAALYLVRRQKFEVAAMLIAIFLICINTAISTNGLGIHSINNLAFPIVLIFSSLVVNARRMFILTTMCVLGVAWLVFGELNGWYTPGVLIRSVPGDFISASVVIVITALMTRHLTGSLFQSFKLLQGEISDRKQIEFNLRKHESLMEAVTFSAEQFLKSPDWRLNINTVLERLGREFEVSHAYLFENHEGPDGVMCSSIIYEWTTPGVTSDLENPEFHNRPIYSDGMDRLDAILERGEPLVGSTSMFTPEEQIYIASIGLKALLEIRVMVNGNHWGTLGVDEVEHVREWSAMEVDVIRIAAGVLGAAIERKLTDDVLKNELIERQRLINELEIKNAESETLRETTEIITSTLNISEAVRQILQQLQRVVHYDSASVWLFKGNVAHQIGADGLPKEATSVKQHFISKDEPDYPLWAEGNPYIILSDIQEKYEKFRTPPLNYIHSWLAIPLKVRGKFTGFISLDGKEVGQFSDHDAQLALNYANQVSIALENARLFSDLQIELNERKKLIHELENKNSELERFTYTVSHDLKSPLVTIDGFLRYIERDIETGNIERFKTDMDRVKEAVKKMQRLLMELLELSRIGRMMNESVAISFGELVHEAVEAVHGRLDAKKVKIIIQSDLPNVLGDHPRLVEMLQNLIDNASKYMGDQAEPVIEIGTRGMEEGKSIFFVKDNGIGIAPEHHNRIFELFNKLDATSEGTGVGLALVRRIIEVHGGRIWVESEIGKGSTFLFTL